MMGRAEPEPAHDACMPSQILDAVTLPAARDCLRAASRDSLASRVHGGLAQAGVEIGSPVLLLVSGGSDSMALLVLIASLWRRVDHGLERLSVLSFDHGLRPAASEEAALAVRVATHLGVGEAWSERISVSTHGNILANARAARLAAASAACQARALSTVLLGHQADDRAESILLALSRGVSLEAVTALVPRREMCEHAVTLVRPLLDVRRHELRTLLTNLALPWCEDPSNALRTRGAMRRDGLGPEFLSAMTDAVGAFCDEAQEVLSLRDSMAAEILAARVDGVVSRSALEAAHPAVRRAVLIGLLRGHGVSLSRTMVESALARLESCDRTPHTAVCDDSHALLIDRHGARVIRRDSATPASTVDDR